MILGQFPIYRFDADGGDDGGRPKAPLLLMLLLLHNALRHDEWVVFEVIIDDDAGTVSIALLLFRPFTTCFDFDA